MKFNVKKQGGWSYYLVTFPIHNIDTKFKLAITLEGSMLEQNKL